MIIPLSITFSGNWGNLRTNLKNSGQTWLSSFDNIPAAVFSGVSQRCTICLCNKNKQTGIFVAPMYRWRSEYRPYLTTRIEYSKIGVTDENTFGIPKLGSITQYHALKTLIAVKGNRPLFSASNEHKIGFSQAARNFVSVFIEDPPAIDASSLKLVAPSKIGYVKLEDEKTVLIALVALAGEFYLWYWLVRGDGFDVTKWVIADFLTCLRGVSKDFASLLSELGLLLHERRFEALVYKKNAGRYVGNFNYRDLFEITRRADLLLASGLGFSRAEILEILNYVQRVLSINVFAGEKGVPNSIKQTFPPKSIDGEKQQQVYSKVDRFLKQHYGFTDEELDFIINYDIKHRMGDALFRNERDE